MPTPERVDFGFPVAGEKAAKPDEFTTRSQWLHDKHELGRIVVDGSGDFISESVSGTWTPLLRGEASAGLWTFALNEGRFTRVGDYALFEFQIRVTAVSGATGELILYGFPYQLVGLNAYGTVSPTYYIPDAGVYYDAEFYNGFNRYMLTHDTNTATEWNLSLEHFGNTPITVSGDSNRYMYGSFWTKVA